MEHLTHESTNDDVDRETMTLLNISEDSNTVEVCFDGDEDDTAKMSTHTYDHLTEGDDWERKE